MVDELGIVEGARSLVGLIPGAKGNVIGGGVEVLHGTLAGDRLRTEIRESGIDLERAQRHSRRARKYLENLDNLPMRNLKRFGVYGAGSALGGMASAAVLGAATVALPFGGMIAAAPGMLAGGYLAGQLYEGLDKTEQDMVILAAEGRRKQRQGEPADRTHAFATLMASLPPKVQEYYERKLYDRTGSSDFAEATKSREGQKALMAMMHNPRVENLLRDYTGISINPHNPDQSVIDQYVELINGNKLDARDIVLLAPQEFKNKVLRIYREDAVRGQMAMAPGGDAVLPQRQLPATARSEQREV